MKPSALVILVGLGALAALAAAHDQDRFDNYSLYTLAVTDERQQHMLEKLDAVLDVRPDYWKGEPVVGSRIDVMISAQDRTHFEHLLQAYDFKWRVKVPNVQELIDGEQSMRSRDTDGGAFGWTSYHTFDEIMAWLDDQVQAYPDQLTNVVLGQSIEGRPMRGVKLSRKAGNPSIFIESNTHAREWITSATATWILNEFLTSADPEVQQLADNYDWYIFPLVNPDGFVYSHTSNRMWRKNRARHGLICLGTDPNRNWGYQWLSGGTGASSNQCDETYTGPSAFSDPETKLIADFILERKDEIKMYLSFHSYGQWLLYAWSYSNADHADTALIHELCQLTADRIKTVHGTEYTPQRSFDLYQHHGTSVDWTYGEAGIKLSVTMEFRDNGNFGFILPADQIIPNAEEVLQGLIAFVGESQSRGLLDL